MIALLFVLLAGMPRPVSLDSVDRPEVAEGRLVIVARGHAAGAGWTDPDLCPRRVDPDAIAIPGPDGYYEFDLVAVPPGGPATGGITRVEATYRLPGATRSKTYLIRIHGEGGRMLEIVRPRPTQRRA